MLAIAVAHLRAGNYLSAQKAAFRACRGSLPGKKAGMAAGERATMADVRLEFSRLLAEPRQAPQSQIPFPDPLESEQSPRFICYEGRMKPERQAASGSASAMAVQFRRRLDELEAAGVPLDAWQSDMLARAIAHLRTGNDSLAADAGFRACQPEVYRTSAAVIALSDSPVLTIAEVRAALDAALAERAR